MVTIDETTALRALLRGRAPVTTSTAADRIADFVREMVVEGQLQPGERVPERALCEELEVSRNTLREAVSHLVTERILNRSPHRGVFVSRPDADTVREVYEARRVVETGALLLREQYRTERIRALASAVEEGKAGAQRRDWALLANANQHFHRALTGLAENKRLNQQMNLLLAEMRLIFHQMPDSQSFHEPYLQKNISIYELIKKGDRTAASVALSRYLDDARDEVLAAYAARPDN